MLVRIFELDPPAPNDSFALRLVCSETFTPSPLGTVTEPLLAPLRRVIPALGGFDLSFIVLFIIIQVVQNQICSGHRFL